MEKRRIAVIGAGPGGYVAAIRAAQLGGQVTLFEKESLGGVCLNCGCVPTKALLHSAKLLSQMKGAAAFGVNAKEISFDFAAIQNRKRAIVRKLAAGIKGLLVANGVEIVSGAAAFVDAHTLSATMDGKMEQYSFDRIIVACGSRPIRPPVPGAQGEGVLDSAAALALSRVPRSMVIIGGGVIGVELAQVYASLGSEVTILEMQGRILPSIAAEAISPVAASLKRLGIRIETGARVSAIENDGDGLQVMAASAGAEAVYRGEIVLISTGRRAAIEGLALDKAGIRTQEGRIVVDEGMHTSAGDVFAAGDCTGQMMLAHAASRQGEIAAENAMGAKSRCTMANCPACVYTDPEIAQVGMTEEQAAQAGHDLAAGTFPLLGNAKALIAGQEEGFVKAVISRSYGQLLGVQIVGPRATDMIACASLALEMEALAQDLDEAIFPHPTFSECIREAVLDAQGRAIHKRNTKED